MVLLFSFFFCSGGFLVAHGEEPFAPKYVMGAINIRNGENLKRSAGSQSGSYTASTDGFIWLDNGSPSFGSFTFYSNSGSMGFSGTGTANITGFGIYMRGLNGSFVLKAQQMYALYLSSGNGSYVNDQKKIEIHDNTSTLHVVYSDSDTMVFYFDEDQDLNSLRFDGIFSSPVYLYQNNLNLRYASIEALVGFTKDSSSDIIAAIENQTGELDQSITDAGQGVQDKIESQFDTSQGSEVGSAAQGFADQAAESLGVVSYVDTLFSGLSGLVAAGTTTLTFPAFAIAVQGTDYQVWQEHTFDLSQLDGWFSGLMAAVRLATSVVVVGAVIHYLQSVYKDVIG